MNHGFGVGNMGKGIQWQFSTGNMSFFFQRLTPRVWEVGKPPKPIGSIRFFSLNIGLSLDSCCASPTNESTPGTQMVP